ncbi:MAG TPA: J domain-containing protein, partial [Halococcus sp.]|nr:J domain-containing protein [Halococcus sp.]
QSESIQRGRTDPSTAEAYQTLGLDPGADETTVRAAYREKVKEVHPDTEDGNERTFKRVNEAYERLSE